MTSAKKKVTLRLHVLMAEHRLTAKEVSQKTGISESNLSRMRNDEAGAIRIETLQKFYDAYGWMPGDILSVR